MSWQHRLARRADLARIVEIYNATVPSRLVTADLGPVSVDSRLAWFQEHDAQRPIWVVEADGVASGWLSISKFHARAAYDITAEVSVYIDERHHHQGIASYLLEVAVAHARAHGIETLVGLIFGHNVPSLKLFEKLGFDRWAELPRVADLDGARCDLVIVGRRVI